MFMPRLFFKDSAGIKQCYFGLVNHRKGAIRNDNSKCTTIIKPMYFMYRIRCAYRNVYRYKDIRQKVRMKMYKLRIWLAYYIMPKNTRKHLIKALSYSIEELEREVKELSDQIN